MAGDHGGGIYVLGNTTTTLTIQNSQITGNTAYYGGGFAGDKIVINITDSMIFNPETGFLSQLSAENTNPIGNPVSLPQKFI